MRTNLINYRKKAELTQTEAAKSVGVSNRHYQSLEAGTSNGSVEIWQKLKIILNAPSIDYLLEQNSDVKQSDCNRIS